MRCPPLAVLLSAALAGCAGSCGDAAGPDPTSTAPRWRRPEVPDRPPTLLLFVLDTVRADHLSMCGYGRPTSPFLASLARPGRAVWACDAVSPGAWTVPSHATFFTGQSVAEHGIDGVDRVLPADVPTLAEALHAAGYQSVLLSANPTLSRASGLTRGFDVVSVAPGVSAWRGDDLAAELRGVLRELDPAKPLFLVLNVFDAHDPFAPIPNGLGWVSAQPRITYGVHDPSGDGPYHDLIRGRLAPGVAAEFVRTVTDAYDHGVSLADRAVDDALGQLFAAGWTAGPFRLVVTSDHGEYLGERGRLRHGCELDEAVTRVPLLVYGRGVTLPEALPPAPSTRHVFWLVRDGTLGPADVTAEAFASARPDDPRRCADVAASWMAPTKLVWRADGVSAFDLTADPLELQPTPATGAPADALRGRVDTWTRSRAAAARSADVRRRAELDALGY